MLKATVEQVQAAIKREVERLDAYVADPNMLCHNDPVQTMERIKVLNSLLPELFKRWVEPSDRAEVVEKCRLRWDRAKWDAATTTERHLHLKAGGTVELGESDNASLHEMVIEEAALEGFRCERPRSDQLSDIPIDGGGYISYIRGSEVEGQLPYVPIVISGLDLLKNKDSAGRRHLVKSRVRNACLALRDLIGKGPPRAADSALSA